MFDVEKSLEQYKEDVGETEERLDKLQELCDNPINSLFKLRQIFHKWFKYEDETLLDFCLALRVHTEWLKTKSLTPLWLFIVAPSGDRKSETIRAFEDSEDVHLVNHITKNTLASGWKARKKNDLAPKLNKKLILTFDFGQFLKIQSQEKTQIWSQFRSAFDGYVMRITGSGVDTAYKNLRWNWLVGTTPLIDDELILKDQLGTRELIYRMSKDEMVSVEEIQKQVWDNTNVKELMREELSDTINSFLDYWRDRHIKYEDIEIKEETKQRIMMYSRFIAFLRANAQCDATTGELTTFVEPEKPTRNLEQLKGLFAALKSLSPVYTDKLVLKRLETIAKSSINPVRYAILRQLASAKTLEGDYTPVTISYIRKRLGIGYKTIFRELMTLYQLKFIDYEETASINADWKRRSWFISTPEKVKAQIIKFILEEDTDTETLSKAQTSQTSLTPIEKNSSNKDKLDFLLKALTLPMTLNQIQQQTNDEIPHYEIPKLLNMLATNGRIYQPDPYHYQRIG